MFKFTSSFKWPKNCITSLCGSGDIYEILVVYLQHIIPNYILLSTIPISEFFSALDILSQINQGELLIIKIYPLVIEKIKCWNWMSFLNNLESLYHCSIVNSQPNSFILLVQMNAFWELVRVALLDSILNIFFHIFVFYH